MSSYQYIDLTGVIIPDTADTLAAVQSEYRAAFGADLVVTPDTPQGVLITAEALARDAVIRNNADLANQINPNLAGGVFLDAICALTGLERTTATRSSVTADVTGVAATLIPAGSQAQTAAGDVFFTAADVTLDGSGEGSVLFYSLEYGPIPCGVGALDQIVTGVLGWETVNNPLAAALGVGQQTDQSLRAQRRRTLALQGISVGEAITSALYAVEGVKSLTFRENVAATTQTIDGISMVAHSIYVCVDGGTDANVAAALLENKTVGAAWNGSVTESVIDVWSGQTYAVTFDRPTEIDIAIRVTIRAGTSLTDPTTAVKDAIMTYVDGELGDESGFTVGNDVSPFELAGAINQLNPSIFVRLVEISDDGGLTWQSTEYAIAVDEVARTSQALIQVVIS